MLFVVFFILGVKDDKDLQNASFTKSKRSVSLCQSKTQNRTQDEREQEVVQISYEVKTKAGKRSEREQKTNRQKADRVDTQAEQFALSSIPSRKSVPLSKSEQLTDQTSENTPQKSTKTEIFKAPDDNAKTRKRKSGWTKR